MNKQLLLLILLISIFSIHSLAQDTLYYEYFTDGAMNLDWFTPWEEGDTMQVDYWEGNPSGDNWVGFIENGLSGGGVGTALSGELNMTDYEVSAQIYCTVNTSTYHGLVARWDTVGTDKYYYLRTDFDGDQRLQLRKFPGNSGMGDNIATWIGAQIPGGVPTSNSWHELALKVQGDQIWAYYDGNLLSGSPFTDSYISRGFFGIYCFNFASTTETNCDDILVLGEAGAQPFDLIANSYVMLDQNMQPMDIRAYEDQTVYFQFDWDAVNGEGTSRPFTVTLKIDNVVVYTENNPGVEPNSSHTSTSNAWSAAIGDHSIEWTLDAGNNLNEPNETNNTLQDDILVLSPNAYDLSADSTWIANSQGNKINWVAQGDPVYFILFWSAAMGTGFSNQFDIDMELDGTPFFNTTTFGVFQQGNNVTMTNIPWTAQVGFHYFMWYLDTDNNVDEFSEDNNFLMDGLEVNLGIKDPWGLNDLIPSESRISSVFPNPFNPEVTLNYELKTAGHINLTVYDANGREIAILIDSQSPAGKSSVTWAPENLASGVYYAVLSTVNSRSIQPLLFVK